MAKKNYYILSEGILKRKENTIYFHNEKGKKPIPINKVYSIYAYGQITFSSQVMSLLSKNGIPIHFFNFYGFYSGSYYPRETLLSGDLVVKQSSYYLDNSKRLELAKFFVEGSAKNILKVSLTLNNYGTFHQREIVTNYIRHLINNSYVIKKEEATIVIDIKNYKNCITNYTSSNISFTHFFQ